MKDYIFILIGYIFLSGILSFLGFDTIDIRLGGITYVLFVIFYVLNQINNKLKK